MMFHLGKYKLDLENCGLAKYQLWCCGLCGILTKLNHNNPYSLEFMKITSLNVSITKATIEAWWSINTKNDLLSTLNWLEEEGHNAQFEDFVELFEENPGITDTDLQNLCEEYEELNFNQLKCVREYYQTVGERYIKAWDYGRYIFLCRSGYTCQYLSREEALELIEKMGRKVRASFRSWEEFGENYCIGRRFWSADEPQNEIQVYRQAHKACKKLLKKNGAWTKVPWDWSEC